MYVFQIHNMAKIFWGAWPLVILEVPQCLKLMAPRPSQVLAKRICFTNGTLGPLDFIHSKWFRKCTGGGPAPWKTASSGYYFRGQTPLCTLQGVFQVKPWNFVEVKAWNILELIAYSILLYIVIYCYILLYIVLYCYILLVLYCWWKQHEHMKQQPSSWWPHMVWFITELGPKMGRDHTRHIMEIPMNITGWWFQPLWKNMSQLGSSFPTYGKIKVIF